MQEKWTEGERLKVNVCQEKGGAIQRTKCTQRQD